MTALDQSRIGSTSNAPRVAVHLAPVDIERALRRDVLEGFTAHPKELSPKWLYDDRGCDLFDQITRLSEYYPTQCERSILVSAAPHVAALSDADTLVELGSGTSDKTRLMLDALRDAGTLQRFAPFDVAEATLRDAVTLIGELEPAGAVAAARHAVVVELVADLRRLDDQLRDTKKRITPAVKASKTTLTDLFGVGPIVAAIVIGDVGDISRLANRDACAAYNGTAPIEVSSGARRKVLRLSRCGNLDSITPST